MKSRSSLTRGFLTPPDVPKIPGLEPLESWSVGGLREPVRSVILVSLKFLSPLNLIFRVTRLVVS